MSATWVDDWVEHAGALAEELIAAGKLTSPEWQAAVRAVPRHVFVPSYYVLRDGEMVHIDPRGERAEWLSTVYSNTALVTKIGTEQDGALPAFLSSSSTPGLMTRMLEVLDVHSGHRVLEIGTGTGYNAALLSHRVGDSNVYSVDIEPDLVDAARDRLAELGYHPTLTAGDGASSVEGAPFDRILATCSVPAIPWSWVSSTSRGGVILADVRVGLNAGNLVRLVRVASDRAEGFFDPGQASFMALRHHPGDSGRIPYARPSEPTPSTGSVTMLDPRTPWTNPVVWFLAARRIGPHYRLGYSGGTAGDGPEAVVLSTPDGSRCEITLTPDSRGRRSLRETGPTRLWAQVETAHRQWMAAGSPGWSRVGLTVTPTVQTVFVDDPSSALATLTAADATQPR